MKKILIISLLYISIIFSEQVSINQVRIVSENFISSRINENVSIKSIDIFEKNNLEIYHIINFYPKGFILISSDNRVKPILGFSFKNNFKTDNMPPNLNWLLDQYYNGLELSIESRILLIDLSAILSRS